jgi:hypothetical protein
MKQLLLALSMLVLVLSCKQHQVQTPVVQREQTLVVHAFDYSKSSTHSYFDSICCNELYSTLAVNGGGAIKVVGITNNSDKQDVLSLTVSNWDTPSTSGIRNIYQRLRAVAKNKKHWEQCKANAAPQIARYIRAIQQPRDQDFTDLQGAFDLSKQTLLQENYANYKKVLIVSSDARNDPSWARNACLRPIDLPNTIVVFIRPMLSEAKLQKVFPNSRVYVFTDAHDAISFITKP